MYYVRHAIKETRVADPDGDAPYPDPSLEKDLIRIRALKNRIKALLIITLVEK